VLARKQQVPPLRFPFPAEMGSSGRDDNLQRSTNAEILRWHAFALRRRALPQDDSVRIYGRAAHSSQELLGN
jgi:hypothetical protein